MKILSGGQTGVDRAALDVALDLSLACGGWCPKGRRAEDGPIADRYPLVEAETADYAERTRRNVQDSDGTLVLTCGEPTGGTALTIQFAKREQRPHLVIDIQGEPPAAALLDWCREHAIKTLNIAGPRDDDTSDIYHRAHAFLHTVLAALADS